VSGDALDALLERMARAAPAEDAGHLLPLPHAVPQEFYSRLPEFEDEAFRVVRAERKAQREEQGLNPAPAGVHF
jgi:hypothetical protein